MKAKKILLLLLAAVFLTTGCRTRTNGSSQSNTESSVPRSEIQQSGAFPDNDNPRENEESSTDENEKNSSRKKENPEASRKEYDENAPAEIVAGTDHLIHSEGEGSGASSENSEAENSVTRLDGQAKEAATQTVAAEEAEQMGVSEDAETADSAMTYFSVLIQDRMGSLFECQRADVYWETAEDHVTVHKSSPEHALILEAGAYDVSSRLLPENLRVDDGWVARKNPQVIVKIVDGSVLGSGVSTTGAAKIVLQALLSREGWAAIDAVKSRQILLLSEELLKAPHLRTAAMLLIAKTANPSLFEDVDVNEALQMLTEEATGTLPTGIWYYTEKE